MLRWINEMLKYTFILMRFALYYVGTTVEKYTMSCKFALKFYDTLNILLCCKGEALVVKRD
jgi:hypothetical protein